MKLEDVDFEIQYSRHKFKISELSHEDIDQIKKINQAILMENIFGCEVKSMICAFQLYVESIVATNEWAEQGNPPH